LAALGCCLAALALPASAAAATPAAAPAVTTVVSEPVTFTVSDVNHSLVPCGGSGATYRVHGSIVGPAGSLSSAGSAATLYLHGLGYGKFFWDFTAVPGYDFASQMAALGHVSVIIDRLGYGASDHPPGMKSCVGAQADVAHQIVHELRTGSYQATGGSPLAFSSIALIGHSVGGAIAQAEAYSFHDVNALGVLSWADQGPSPFALATFATAGGDCLVGPASPARGGSSYAPFGTTAAVFDKAMFHNTDLAVVAAVNAARNPDPCGDDESIPQALAADQLFVPTIRVPVLLLYGAGDALFPPPAGTIQRLRFLGAKSVTFKQVPNTGHAVTLERTAPTVLADISSWLGARGF
jgi:pimeloyl-ACP methyl ester carboxylesterase